MSIYDDIVDGIYKFEQMTGGEPLASKVKMSQATFDKMRVHMDAHKYLKTGAVKSLNKVHGLYVEIDNSVVGIEVV